jgi:hypothetical protein
MKTIRKAIPLLFRLVRAALVAITFIFAFFCIDHLPGHWNDIVPPPNLATIDDFRTWKNDKIMAEGVYETGGETYQVILGEYGAFLASGPAAYVFDSKGTFVDWTRDMGDLYTAKHRFDLTSGHVRINTNQ